MSATTFTVPTIVVLLPLCVIVCLPVWFASRWVGQRIQARLLAKLKASFCPTCDGAGFYHHSEEQETCEACDGTGDRRGSGAPYRGEGT